MNFRPRSQRRRITLVTSPVTIHCRHSLVNAIMISGKIAPGKKCRPGQKLHGQEAIVGRRHDQFRRASSSSTVHVPWFHQIGVFHRPGWQLAGVKCQMVTEVRPSPRIHKEERTFATCGNPRISLRLQAGQVSRSARRRPPPPQLFQPRANPLLRRRVRLQPPPRTRPRSANRW